MYISRLYAGVAPTPGVSLLDKVDLMCQNQNRAEKLTGVAYLPSYDIFMAKDICTE